MENLKKFKEFKKQNESDEIEYYQKIMDIGYDEWQKNDNWTYPDMIEWVKQNYGEDYSFMILFGKLNQQVGNGGFMQYWDNGYASIHSSGFGNRHSDSELHEEIISYLEKNLLDIPHRAKLLDILKTFNESVQDIGDECPECHGDGEVENYDYDPEDEYDDEYLSCPECDGGGKISYDSHLSFLDDRYYDIDNDIMDYLENHAKKLLTQ